VRLVVAVPVWRIAPMLVYRAVSVCGITSVSGGVMAVYRGRHRKGIDAGRRGGYEVVRGCRKEGGEAGAGAAARGCVAEVEGERGKGEGGEDGAARGGGAAECGTP
jgi:hypothetical protein